MAVVTDEHRKNPALAGWVAAKDKENATPSQANPALVQQHQQAAQQFTTQNWGPNGTANGLTANQNLAAVIQQPGNPVANNMTPYLNGVVNQAKIDSSGQNGENTAPPPPQGGNVGTAAPTGMNLAMSQLQTYVPPKASGLNYDQATNQVKGQLDPMFQRALEALKAQQHQDQLNGDQLGMARGGSHSGLAADLQNKVNIGAAGKAADLDATRQTQIAEMAQALVNRGEDMDMQKRNQALAEYLGLNQLDLQRAGLTGTLGGQQTLAAKSQDQNYGLNLAGLTGNIGGQQTLQAKGQAFDQNLATNQYNQGVNNDQFNQNLATKQFDYNVSTDSRDFDYKKAQDSWSQTFAKEQYSDQKAATLWEQTFKNKSFQQDMKDAAASRGLQWASLTQRDKEFVADQEFREQTFKAGQDQLKIENDRNSFNDDVDNIFKRRDMDLKEAEANKIAPGSYKDDPDFKADIANMVKVPLAAREELRNNSQAYIAKYGIDGYNAMIGLINK